MRLGDQSHPRLSISPQMTVHIMYFGGSKKTESMERACMKRECFVKIAGNGRPEMQRSAADLQNDGGNAGSKDRREHKEVFCRYSQAKWLNIIAYICGNKIRLYAEVLATWKFGSVSRLYLLLWVGITRTVGKSKYDTFTV